MSSNAELHLSYKVGNAPISLFPFPHMFVENVFPADFYEELQKSIPDPEAMIPIEEARPVKGYKERFVLALGEPEHLARLPAPKREFWQAMQEWLVGGRFGQLLFSRFAPFIEQRYKGQPTPQFYDESLLVRDATNYSLGPHTDATRKVITLLFYLPRNLDQAHLGTSIYVPKDPNFSCPGGPHYPRERFDHLYTMPFRPNSLFCFLKTYNSFHGVEPVADENCKRWLLLYDVYADEGAPAAQAQPPASAVKFSF